MKLVFATRNKGKLVELRELLPDVTVVPVDEAMPEVIEDADTFAGNAAKKALEVSAWMKLPALADDSGLEVCLLDGAMNVLADLPVTHRAHRPRVAEAPPDYLDVLHEMEMEEAAAHGGSCRRAGSAGCPAEPL